MKFYRTVAKAVRPRKGEQYAPDSFAQKLASFPVFSPGEVDGEPDITRFTVERRDFELRFRERA